MITDKKKKEKSVFSSFLLLKSKILLTFACNSQKEDILNTISK